MQENILKTNTLSFIKYEAESWLDQYYSVHSI